MSFKGMGLFHQGPITRLLASSQCPARLPPFISLTPTRPSASPRPLTNTSRTFLLDTRSQSRDFHTRVPLHVTARDPRSEAVATFSEPTADVITHKSIFGGQLDVHSFPDHKQAADQDVCRQLQHEQFSDHRLAFASKTAFELARSTLFFFLFKYRIFTDRSEQVLNLMRKVLGERLSLYVIKRLIYDQYVAGETTQEIRHVVNRLQKDGIGPLIAVPIEDDVGHSHGSAHAYEEILNKNCAKILGCMDLCMEVAGSNPMFQLRVTALMSPKLITTLSEACSVNGGDAISTSSLKALVQGILGQTMDIPKTPEWDRVVAHRQELDEVLERVRQITEKISAMEIVGMVDAESTYFNPAIRHLTFAMMEVCNKDKPLVFHTYQAYLKKGYTYLTSDLSLANSRGICFGAKLVRGAYMVKERKRASSGIPDPVNTTYEDTGVVYQRCLDALMEAAGRDEDRVRFIVASHNEDSVRHAFKRMSSLGLPLDSKAVLFGQLYGMADHVSYTLGKKGCRVVKSLPYGSVDDTIPYLARRAHENRSIFDNVRKEKQMVRRALWDRVLRRS